MLKIKIKLNQNTYIPGRCIIISDHILVNVICIKRFIHLRAKPRSITNKHANTIIVVIAVIVIN